MRFWVHVSSRRARLFFLEDGRHCTVLLGEDGIIVNPWAVPCPEFGGSWGHLISG